MIVTLPDLPKALDQGLASLPENWPPEKLHATDLSVYLDVDDGGGCERQLWLRLNGAKKKDPSPGQRLMFDNGHRLHKRAAQLIQDGLERGWSLVWTERSAGDYMPDGMTGTPDAMLVGPDGERVIVDFKTQRGRSFNWLKKDGAKASHVLQVQTYMHFLDAESGMILYIDREGQNQALQFRVERDDERVKAALRYAQSIWDRDKPPGILPPKIKRNKNKGPDSIEVGLRWQCNYCPFLDVSCDGALEPDQRVNGIVGHVDEEGRFTPKDGYEHLSSLVEEAI